MNQLLILGAGGHGKVMAEAAGANGAWQRIALLDDRHEMLNGTLRWPVIGRVAEASRFVAEYSDAMVAVGDSATRLSWLDMLVDQGFRIPVLTHPAAWVSASAVLGAGCVVMANATLQSDCELGRGCIVNTGSTVDHDCQLADGVHVCPGVNLGGGVQVGKGSWLGIGSSVIHGIRIGEHVTVGAGAVVIDDIADGLTVAGVPAKTVSSK